MNWQPVQRSNIRALAWENETLFVQFHHGGECAYDKVPEGGVFKAVLQAESVGKALNTEVKGRFSYRKLEVAA